ncbi:MAG TPA: hypothetical protein VHU19_00410 [Pyrinomonadaceae bacterium]|jgi:hypothetical protein|nr:hypothetical protein [Pyrinomonadaceae bacterium]
MKRILYILLVVLALVASGLPITESLAKWSRRAAAAGHHRHHRRHSRAWWRKHRALMRSRRERAEQRQQQQQSAACQTVASNTALPAAGARVLVIDNAPLRFSAVVADAGVARLSQFPFDFQVPRTWTPMGKAPAGVAAYSMQTADGRQAGVAIVSPVSLSASDLAAAPSSARTKLIGGLPIAALRRTVIDRMVAEGGWVANDAVREVHGRRVLVVTAETGTPGAPSKTWTFYFTEVDGRVYSLATTTPFEFTGPVAAGSEQLMASLRPAGNRSMASQK